MNSINTGGPAFPNNIKITDENFSELRGMTLRDYFAAKALQGICANPNCHAAAGEDKFAEAAYEVADAMLKAREQ
jgi:hypothetical protein